MKADFFTKVVLTVIAVNLTILTVRDLDIIPKAHANEPTDANHFVTNSHYGLVPLNDDGTISVKLMDSDEIDVNIVGISTYDELEVDLVEISTNDELDVNIDEIGGSYVSSGGPIAVEIED